MRPSSDRASDEVSRLEWHNQLGLATKIVFLERYLESLEIFRIFRVKKIRKMQYEVTNYINNAFYWRIEES